METGGIQPRNESVMEKINGTEPYEESKEQEDSDDESSNILKG